MWKSMAHGQEIFASVRKVSPKQPTWTPLGAPPTAAYLPKRRCPTSDPETCSRKSLQEQ